MKNPKTLIDCSINTFIVFFAVPILMLGIRSVDFLSFGLFILFPIVCLICGVLCGRDNGFQIYYPLLSGVLFLPSVFLFYGVSVWPLMILYMAVALAGVAVGHFATSRASNRRSNGRLK